MVIMMKKELIYSMMLVCVLIVTACTAKVEKTDKSSQIANPASVYCTEHGGTLKIVDTPDGQTGICTLKDGVECDEWAYFRSECPAK